MFGVVCTARSALKVTTLAIVSLAVLAGCKTTQVGYQPAPSPVYTQPSPPPPPPPPAHLDTRFGTSKGDQILLYSVNGSRVPGKVTVCIKNNAGNRDVGMHFKNAKKPRYVVKKKRGESCGDHPAGPHTPTWFFYKRNAVGKWQNVANRPLNATGFANRTIYFDWRK